MRKKYLLIATTLFLLPLACERQLRDQAIDASFEGFIDADCAQLIVRVAPDKKAEGLVKLRESASANAQANETGYILDALLRFTGGEHPAADLRARLEPFTGKRERVAQYFDEDNSLVIVYRLRRTGLRSSITALQSDAR